MLVSQLSAILNLGVSSLRYVFNHLLPTTTFFKSFFNVFQVLLLWAGLVLMLRLFIRSRFFPAFRQIIKNANFALIIGLISLVADSLINYYVNQIDRSRIGLYILFWSLIYFLNLLFIGYLFWQYHREQRIKNSEAMILQQESYVVRLEKVQQELRKVHHDYKNIATGLYAQMEAGEIEKAKSYINEKLLQLDQDLQLDIQQLNQLGNIKVVELKTLLLSKINLTEKKAVRFSLEALLPVEKIPLEISDFLRCLGIVLDNAIEAAELTFTKEIHVIFLQEPEKLTIIVKNPTTQAVDLQKIFKIGYSTKGSERGLGLSILREISHSYHNFILETQQEAGYLKQILLFHSAKEK